MPEVESGGSIDIGRMGRLASDLVASDRSYFALGAAVDRVGPAEVVWMEGFTDVAAGCVTWVDPDGSAAGSTDWVDSAIAKMHEVGARLLRIYCQEVAGRDLPPRSSAPTGAGGRQSEASPALPRTGGSGEELSRRLVEDGFTRRSEIGFATSGTLGRGRDDVRLRPVEDDAGWKEKADLQGEADLASDGHGGPTDGFVALERAKCDTGAMSAFLIEVDGEVAGAVATITQGSLLRVKNLYISPGFRGQGVGAAVLYRSGEMVAERGLDGMGMFGVAGTRGSALYTATGLPPVAELIEWSRPARPAR